MKTLITLAVVMLISCNKQEYMWQQRKVALTKTGYVWAGDWQPLDTSHAQPIYKLRKIKVSKTIYAYGINN